MPDTSKLEKLNRELEKSEKKLRKALNDEKALQHQLKHRRSFLYILFRRSGAHPYDTLLYTSPPSGSTPFSASSSATVTNRYPCCCK